MQAANNINNQLGFYLAGSNQEIINNVERMMGKKGVVGVTDMLGHVHYLIDARQGSPLAMRRVLELKEELASSNWKQENRKSAMLDLAISEIMETYQFSAKLRGYRYLEYALQLAIYERNFGQPFRKMLYPTLAEHFHCKPSNIERNLRYLFEVAIATIKESQMDNSAKQILIRFLEQGNSQILLLLLRNIEQKLK